MKEILQELWYGNIAPMEQCGANDREINHLLRLMEEDKDRLSKELKDQQWSAFETYVDHSEEFTFRNATLAFVEGFRLASKLMSEAL